MNNTFALICTKELALGEYKLELLIYILVNFKQQRKYREI